MKVLLIQSYLGKGVPVVYPLGLAYLATAASAHECRIFDPNLHDKPYEAMAAAIRDFGPDVVGLSLRNVDNQQVTDFQYYYAETFPTLSTIKKNAPKARIIIGGAAFSMFPRQIMERHREIDLGLYLEAEETFPKLLDNLETPERVDNVYYRRDGQVHFTKQGPAPDFAALPIPRRDLARPSDYEFPRGSVGVQTKRGCPFKCSYCNYPVLNGNKLRMRKPLEVVDEIEALARDYGVSTFMFADGVFSTPRRHAMEICDEIIRRGLKVKWHAWCDVKDITEEFVDRAVEAGCVYINISPDALKDNALKGLNKSFREEDIRRAYSILKRKRGLRFGMGFFISTPAETSSSYISTLWFFLIENIKAKFIKNGGGSGIGWIRIEPDTGVYDESIAHGVITKETDLLPPDDKGHKILFYKKPGYGTLDRVAELIMYGFDAIRKMKKRGPRP